MPSEEEKVSLIVESDNLTSSELRLRWKERTEESTDRVTKEGCEVVEDQFSYTSVSLSLTLITQSSGHTRVWRRPGVSLNSNQHRNNRPSDADQETYSNLFAHLDTRQPEVRSRSSGQVNQCHSIYAISLLLLPPD